MNAIKTLATILSFITMQYATAQETMPLYPPGIIPGSKPSPNEETSEQRDGVTIVSKISVPTITVYPAPEEKATGTAVVIFPGGGYWINAISHEGSDVAKKFNEWGITAFVVKYRIPDERTMLDPSTGPLQDAQQAMLRVRMGAEKWGIDKNRIGVMGFSAGGHLASTIGTHYKESLIDNPGKISLRPDFMILIYPVISADTAISHAGSFDKLLGKKASKEKLTYFSNDKQITAGTPPGFLVHASDDDAVPVANSIVFYEALIKNKVAAELHIYQQGGHGFGMNNPTTPDQWTERLKNWMTANKWLTKR